LQREINADDLRHLPLDIALHFPDGIGARTDAAQRDAITFGVER
jgi:hypothetical protein